MSNEDYNANKKYLDDLSSYAVELGGKENRWSVHVNKQTSGEGTAAGGAEVSSSEDTAHRAGSPLSKSHIRPRYRIDAQKGLEKEGKPPSISWRQGASILKTSQGSNGEKVGGGIRKPISGFSTDSRRRLIYAIASIRKNAELPCFVTLTYPKEFPDPKTSKRHLKMFNQRLQRAYPQSSAIWKLEPQERGAPHYHLLVWGVDEHNLTMFTITAWYDIAGNGDANHLYFHMGLLGNQKCVNQVRSWRGVWSYASKYLGKTFEVAGWDNLYTGRFWGYVNKDEIPFGQLCEYEYPKEKVFHVMRYQRRFSKRKTSNKGFTLFCDADQWIKNIFSEAE